MTYKVKTFESDYYTSDSGTINRGGSSRRAEKESKEEFETRLQEFINNESRDGWKLDKLICNNRDVNGRTLLRTYTLVFIK